MNKQGIMERKMKQIKDKNHSYAVHAYTGERVPRATKEGSANAGQAASTLLTRKFIPTERLCSLDLPTSRSSSSNKFSMRQKYRSSISIINKRRSRKWTRWKVN